MSEKKHAAKEALRRSRIALREGDKDLARKWAKKAASLAPTLEDVWLLLAATSSPELSIRYLERALTINSQSKRAKEGMLWAQKRLAQKESTTPQAQVDGDVQLDKEAEKEVEKAQPAPVLEEEKRESAPVGIPLSPSPPVEDTQPIKATAFWGNERFRRLLFFALLSIFFIIPAVWIGKPRLSSLAAELKATPTATFSQDHWGEAKISKPTYTPSPTATFTPTATPTKTSTPTKTPTPTETARPTKTPVPTEVYEEEEYSYGGQKYVLVDISEQHLYAYEGNTLVFSFIASTGMNNATATGSFSILNKIPSAYGSTWDIWMPSWLGIYWVGTMQNGIHALPIMSNGGTLWAGYLGTPISYGCVVLSSYEAQLLYNWVDIGTPVDIRW